MELPNIAFLLTKSIGLSALGATVKPGADKSWSAELQNYVLANGKFTQSSVGYLPFSPPPVFWDYKCKKCRFFMSPDGCLLVEGIILPQGWCVVWMPPDDYKAFTWPGELLRGNW